MSAALTAESVSRLERAIDNGRRYLVNVKAAEKGRDGSRTHHAVGVFVMDTEELMNASEAVLRTFGDIDEGPAEDFAAARLLPTDITTALQHQHRATKAARSSLLACQQFENSDDRVGWFGAGFAHIKSMTELMDAADNMLRVAKAPRPKPAAAPIPTATQLAEEKLAEEKLAKDVLKAVTDYVAGEMGKHAEAEREVIQRMVRDSLGDLKDSIRTREDVRELKDLQAQSLVDRRIADLGKSLVQMVNKRIEETQNKAAKEAARHATAQANKVRKDLQSQLARDDDAVQAVAGEMPRHQWNGTKIRFEQEPGVWGPWVDVEGPRGRDGVNGAGGAISTKRLEMDGGGAFDENTTLDGKFASTDLASQPGIGGGGAGTVFEPRAFNGGRSI